METSVKPTLLVTTSTLPRWEGDSEPRFVFDLCTRLTNAFNVLVIAPHSPGASTFEQCGALQVYRYRYAPEALETLAYNGGITANLKQNRWKYLLLPAFFIGQWLLIRKLLKQEQIAVIHAHWLIPQGLIAALAIIGQKNKPGLLCTSHGGDLFGLKDPFSTYLKRWVIQKSNVISVVSEAMTQKISELVQETSAAVIPMGADLAHTFIPPTNTSRNHSQLLFTGRLVEKKGIHHLLHALRKVVKVLPKTTLVIVGSGPLQLELETLTRSLYLSKHVEFKGRLEHSGLVKLYQQSGLAVFPFIQARDGDMEGLGLVMVEALGCGCPVIASDLPAVRDVIKHEETGYLVPPGNEELLSARLIECLNTPELTYSMTSSARQWILQRFDWQLVSHTYSKQLKQTITLV